MEISSYLKKRKKIIDANLLKLLPKGTNYTKVLRDAVKYSVMSGGKRIRPIMTLAACEAVSGSYKKAVPLAVAIEMIHTYTLIHDDLPAMDDDDFRRGKLTCHKKFGEDIAILTGDMLNTLAFEVIAKNYGALSSKLITELAGRLGLDGVVGGQVADLISKKSKIRAAEMDFINTRKTAYLFIASAVCGGISGGAEEAVLAKLRRFALHLGLAFQITDDILDYRPGHRLGYPALIGIERSKKEAKRQIDSAIGALPRDKKFRRLKEIAAYLAKRKE